VNCFARQVCLTMTSVKYPLLTGFLGGLVIFAGCAYVGYRGAAAATYRWRKPYSFESLKRQNEMQLRDNLLALQTVAFSQFREDAPASLQNAADYLRAVRRGKQPDVRSVLDLQIATCYVEMARLEGDAGNATAASRDQQMAENILHSLGWQDVSNEKLAQLTRRELWWKRPK